MSDAHDALERVLDVLADGIARRLLAGGQSGWIDQGSSPLGPRRHCAAVRRRIATKAHGAAIIGRRLILSEQALGEELAAVEQRPRTKKPKEPSPAEAMRHELELIRGGRS